MQKDVAGIRELVFLSSCFTELLENYKSRQALIWSKKDQVEL